MFPIGFNFLFDGYVIPDKILCDGYVIERNNQKHKLLSINIILCDGYVIERNNQKHKLLNNNTILCYGHVINSTIYNRNI
jgi:hypothetical protein